jgi:hypothetical protein
MILQPIDNTTRVENMGAGQSTDLFAQTISGEQHDDRKINVFRQNRQRRKLQSKHKNNDRVTNSLTVPDKCSILDCFRPRDPLERPKSLEADEWLEPRRRVFFVRSLEVVQQPLAERRMEIEAAVVVAVVVAAAVAVDLQFVSRVP